jgi:hypothetical protein
MAIYRMTIRWGTWLKDERLEAASAVEARAKAQEILDSPTWTDVEVTHVTLKRVAVADEA